MKADAKGVWSLTLPAMPAGGPFTLGARTASKTQTANDVLVGDVWLCSGQSNMEWPVRNTLDAGSEVALSANERIRQVTIARATSAAPRTDFDAPLEWKVAGPDDHRAFLRHLLLLRARTAENRERAAGHHLLELGRLAHRALDERSRAARRSADYQAPLGLLGEYRTNQPLAFPHWGEIWQKWWTRAARSRRARKPWVAAATRAVERGARGARTTGKPGMCRRSAATTA